ncbi:MAG: putative Zn-dependent protease [Oleiphilaceae bacterium]|jgi:predicted Zn-dependent protease
MRRIPYLLLLVTCFTITGCAVNAVTGKQQLMFTSMSDDIEIGKAQYKPTQQSQGGAYYLDSKLSNYISAVGNKLARVSDQPDLPYEFVVLNNSVPNAWALPSGKIAINRGLLVQLENEAQLAAVLSHEVVHAAARHGAQRMRDNMFIQASIAGLGLTLADNDYRSLIIGGASLGAQLTVAKYGRNHELESDQYGMQYMAKAGYNLQGAVDLQTLFVKLSKGQKSSWIDGLFASHPPSPERVAENKKHLLRLQNKASDAFTGTKEYQAALSNLRKQKPAYDLADQASQALNSKQTQQALSLINQAIHLVPAEALFHATKGLILDQQGKPDLALKEHNRATELYPQQFSYFLNRANTQLTLGNSLAAQEDYQHSMRMLPTSTAALHLGHLFQKSGKRGQALAYYSQAASALGKEGEEARLNLALLEIHDKPEKYLRIKHKQDTKGPLLVTVANSSPLEIKKLTLVSRLFDHQRSVIKEVSWQINEPLKAGERSRHFPMPVSYHLKPDEYVQTTVREVVIQH